MTQLNFCGWRPVFTRVLLCGAIIWQMATWGVADDKGDKQRGASSRRNEPAPRVERSPPARVANPPRAASEPNRNRSNFSAPQQPKLEGAGAGQRFQPSFGREPVRVKLQPTKIDTPPSTVNLPTGAIQLEGRPTRQPRATDSQGQGQVKPQGSPQQLAFLPEKGDKGPKGGSAPKSPAIEKPVKIQETPRVPQIRQREQSNPAPQIKPQLKVKIEDRPNTGRPGNPAGPVINRDLDKKPDGKIQIKKPNRADQPRPQTSDIKGNKIRVDTIHPNPKVQTSPNTASKAPREKPARLKEGETLTRVHHEQIKGNLDKQHRDLVAQGKAKDREKVVLPNNIKKEGHDRLQKLPREALKLPVAKNGKIDPQVAAKLKIRPAHEVLEGRRKNGDLQHFAKLHNGKALHLDRQFQFHRQGDIGRRMNLIADLQYRGGWRHRHFGPISPLYSSHCRSMWYAGPGFCAPYVWYPNWSPWVDWCWWDTCAPIYDPRPIFCQPVVYHACTPWVAWQFPVWRPLPYLPCGSWVDVSPVVINAGADVQLLATRFVDPGHPEHELGPRFRVWIRNNSSFDINQEFNVLLLASNDANAFAGLPEAGVRVARIRAGETQSIDIRLPYAANSLGRNAEGQPIPFSHLNVLVDSHNEISEAFEDNNGATLVRSDILPVDPAAFAAEPASAQPGGIIHIAGEGLGPEPGQAMVVIGEQEYQAEILGWFDLGIQIRVPDFDLDESTAADLVIIRGDGAASNPLTIEIDPQATIPTAPAAPVPDLPDAPPLPEPFVE